MNVEQKIAQAMFEMEAEEIPVACFNPDIEGIDPELVTGTFYFMRKLTDDETYTARKICRKYLKGIAEVW